LAIFSALYLFAFLQFLGDSIAGIEGIALATGNPAGGDFINLYSVARMVLEGEAVATYFPEQLMQFQRSLIEQPIGLRLWAYPPHSLLFVWPFGGLSYFVALALWSALGLFVLGLGARRMGFGWLETILLVASPASMQSIYFGQTGNFAAGALLLALSARKQTDVLAISATALLTIKAQFGFLLPTYWALEKQWRLILLVSAATLGLFGLTFAVFGSEVWRAYFEVTVPVLSNLESSGTGAFMQMIPSTFMAFRILGLEGGAAMPFHLAFAALVFAMLVFRLVKSTSKPQKLALILFSIGLITPYLHVYDLSLLVAGGFIMLRAMPAPTGLRAIIPYALVLSGWILPHALFGLNAGGWPLGPVIMFALFLWAWSSKAFDEESIE
ncbi:MAG TPA: DUF2029 domain-containing protein, partial [Devosia sp.]|nr:DUF2029 domain-containing protein [Devosia sp.]